MNNAYVLSSWSGGKDSCFACYKAIQQGYRIKYLVNFVAGDSKRVRFHGLANRLIKLQAEAVQIPLHQKEVGTGLDDYEVYFKEGVNEVKTADVQGMVFGDIYLDEHLHWVERVCGELSVDTIEPLWHLSPKDIMHEFVDLGFKAVVVGAQARLFDKDIVGRVIDNEFIQEMERKKVCPCGENGEFHTLVVDGPLFKKKITIIESDAVLKKGYWEAWFLDIKEAALVEKNEKVEVI